MRERERGPDCTETLLEVEAYLDGEVDPDLAAALMRYEKAVRTGASRA